MEGRIRPTGLVFATWGVEAAREPPVFSVVDQVGRPQVFGAMRQQSRQKDTGYRG